eukprot:gene55554-74173_t
MICVPACPATRASMSCSAPMAARPPVAMTKLQAACTLGAMDPAAKLWPASACGVVRPTARSPGTPQSRYTAATSVAITRQSA